MKHTIYFILLTICCSLYLFCGNIPSGTDNTNSSSLDIRIWINKPHSPCEKTNTREMIWDRLVIHVSAIDINTVCDTLDINMDQPYVVGTIKDVPPGKNRLVEAWTLSDGNIIVHYAFIEISELDPGEMITIPLILFPIRGSIFINLAKIPAEVEVVTASFQWEDDTITVSENKSGLMYLSIDYIPDGTAGTLIISGINSEDSVIYSDSVSFIFYVNKDTTIAIQFIADPSGLSMEMYIIKSGVTIVSGFMGLSTSTGPEKGPLIISEIMYYTTGDSDYIEIHNTTSEIVDIAELLLQVVNTSSISTKSFLNVSIPAKGFYVIGDSDAPQDWTDINVSLDLPTTGRWIILRNASDSSIIDWISYMGGGQDWPGKTKYYSIILDSLPEDATYNNYGKNWQLATTEIGTSGHYGTPGQPGL